MTESPVAGNNKSVERTNLDARIVNANRWSPHRWTIKLRFDARLDCCTLRARPEPNVSKDYRILPRHSTSPLYLATLPRHFTSPLYVTALPRDLPVRTGRLRALCAPVSVNPVLGTFLSLQPCPGLIPHIFTSLLRFPSLRFCCPTQSAAHSNDKSSIINTYKSLSKHTTLTPFRMNTYKKPGGRVPMHARTPLGTKLAREVIALSGRGLARASEGLARAATASRARGYPH